MSWFSGVGTWLKNNKDLVGSLGGTVLGGILSRQANKGTNAALESVLGNITQYGEQASKFAEALTGLAPEYQAAMRTMLGGMGTMMGKGTGYLGQSGDYFSGILTDPNKLAEATATTNADQARQLRSNVSAIQRMGGRSGAAAGAAAAAPGEFRRNALYTRSAAKSGAAGQLAGIGQGIGQLGLGTGQLGLGFGRGLSDLYTGAGQILLGPMSALGGLATLKEQGARQGRDLGSALGTLGGNILGSVFDRGKQRDSGTFTGVSEGGSYIP